MLLASAFNLWIFPMLDNREVFLGHLDLFLVGNQSSKNTSMARARGTRNLNATPNTGCSCFRK